MYDRIEVERIAHEEATWQWLKNTIRKMFGLPIRKTSEERYKEVIEQSGEDV